MHLNPGETEQTIQRKQAFQFFFFFFGSVYIPVYSSVNKPGRSYEPLHLRERI
jgi:hypothetical protein